MPLNTDSDDIIIIGNDMQAYIYPWRLLESMFVLIHILFYKSIVPDRAI